MLDKIKHRQIMFEVLQEIYKSEVGKFLGFKGGTMLYFFEELERFSVDLDFDLLEATQVGVVQKKIHQILEKHGQIIEEREKRQTLIFILSYQRDQHHLKVEISKREEKTTRYEWRNFYGVDLKTIVLEDLMAHKMVAATQRRRVANRDFYDIWFLLKRGVLPIAAVIQERTAQELKEYLSFLIEFIEQELKPGQVMVGLGELLDRSKRDWVKAKLKQELLESLKFYRDSLS
jgi:predicted nucleotidyltransferase component of viral defense system